MGLGITSALSVICPQPGLLLLYQLVAEGSESSAQRPTEFKYSTCNAIPTKLTNHRDILYMKKSF